VLYLLSFNIQLHLIQYHYALHFLQVALSGRVMVICLLLFILQLPASEFDLLLLNTKNQIQLLTPVVDSDVSVVDSDVSIVLSLSIACAVVTATS